MNYPIKNIAYIILGIIATMMVFAARCQTIADCPYGDNPRFHTTDSMKNQSAIPKHYEEMPFEILSNYKVGDAPKHINAITTTGYILEIQDGGIESCNCHSKTNRDTHIYVVADETVKDKSEAVIVEVTPRFRKQFGTTADLKKKYLHHTVKISGYLFMDEEHRQNSTVDKGKGLHWRRDVYEIHPVTDMRIVK